MDLTLLELVLLAETPFGTTGQNHKRSNVSQRARYRFQNPTYEDRDALRSLDALEARGFIERVSVAYLRRTIEGQRSLETNLRSLRSLVDFISA